MEKFSAFQRVEKLSTPQKFHKKRAPLSIESTMKPENESSAILVGRPIRWKKFGSTIRPIGALAVHTYAKAAIAPFAAKAAKGTKAAKRTKRTNRPNRDEPAETEQTGTRPWGPLPGLLAGSVGARIERPSQAG